VQFICVTLVIVNVVLIGSIGALTFGTIAALWAYTKLTKWSLSSDNPVRPTVAYRVWRLFVLVVLLVELGPGIAQATVTGVKLIV